MGRVDAPEIWRRRVGLSTLRWAARLVELIDKASVTSFPADHFHACPFSGSLPKIDADSCLIRIVEGRRGSAESENERYANRQTALIRPIV